jgi:hypothetical protein
MTVGLWAFTFPWADRSAQELHTTLTQLYPTPASAALVAQRAGVDTSWLNQQQPPVVVWHDILDLAAQGGITRALVTLVRDLLNPQSPRRPFLDDLLAAQPPPIDPEPRNADGSPRFLERDDTVSEPEALLFRDDLMIENGRVPALIATLQVLYQRSTAVCRITARFAAEGDAGSATGFRIGEQHVLTNHHALHHPATRACPATVWWRDR